MHRLPKAAAIFLVAALVTTPALAGGNANFFVGQRTLDQDDIEGLELKALDDQTPFGVSVDWSVGDWPIHLVAGLYLSSRDETEDFGPLTIDEKVSFMELSFGVNKTWAVSGNVRPFIGGGLVRMEGKLELDATGVGSLDEDDDVIAVYGEGGLYWRLGSAFNLGGAVRLVKAADMEIQGSDFDGDYIQYGLLIGWGWGD